MVLVTFKKRVYFPHTVYSSINLKPYGVYYTLGGVRVSNLLKLYTVYIVVYILLTVLIAGRMYLSLHVLYPACHARDHTIENYVAQVACSTYSNYVNVCNVVYLR